jgi:myosin heavy subunit
MSTTTKDTSAKILDRVVTARARTRRVLRKLKYIEQRVKQATSTVTTAEKVAGLYTEWNQFEADLEKLSDEIAKESVDSSTLDQALSKAEYLSSELRTLYERQLTPAALDELENAIEEVETIKEELSIGSIESNNSDQGQSSTDVTFDTDGESVIQIELESGDRSELSIEELEDFVDKISEIDSYHENIESSFTDIRKEFEEFKTELSEVDQEVTEQMNTFETRFDEMSNRLENDRDTFQQELEEVRSEREHLQKEVNEFKDRQDAVEDLQSEVESLKEEASDLLQETVSGELAAEFENRKQDLQNTLRWWKGASVVSIILLIGFAIWIYFDITASEAATYGLFSKVALILPVSVMVWFSVSNYNRQKRLMHEYEFKKNIAVSMPGFRERLESLTSEDDQELVAAAVLQTMDKIYTNPQEVTDGQSDQTPQVANETGTIGSLLQRGKK